MIFYLQELRHETFHARKSRQRGTPERYSVTARLTTCWAPNLVLGTLDERERFGEPSACFIVGVSIEP